MSWQGGNAMKSITLHPSSVLVGLVLAGAFVVLAGAGQAPGGVQSIPKRDVHLVGHIPAEWWTFVYVEGGFSTYTVPADRHFVVTLCSSGQAIRVNGQPFRFGLSTQALELWQVQQNGTRVVIAPGSLIEGSPGSASLLWGYLEPVRS
jgi:hypothetical protein